MGKGGEDTCGGGKSCRNTQFISPSMKEEVVKSLAAALHGQATGRGSSHPTPIAVVKLATSRNAAGEAVD